ERGRDSVDAVTDDLDARDRDVAAADLDDLRLARILADQLGVVRVGAGAAVVQRVAAVADDRDVDAGVGDADRLRTRGARGVMRADRLDAAESGADRHGPLPALGAGTKGV